MKRNIQKPITLVNDAKKTELFTVIFLKIYFVKKKRTIENIIAKHIIRYRRMVETPLSLILLILLLKL